MGGGRSTRSAGLHGLGEGLRHGMTWDDMGVVLKVLVKKGPLGICISITADPNQTGNVHYGNFGIGFLSNYHIGSFNLGVFTPLGFRIYGVYWVKVSGFRS